MFLFSQKSSDAVVKRQISKVADLPPIYEKPEMPSHHDSLSDDDFDLPHDQEVPGAFDSGEYFVFSSKKNVLMLAWYGVGSYVKLDQ